MRAPTACLNHKRLTLRHLLETLPPSNYGVSETYAAVPPTEVYAYT